MSSGSELAVDPAWPSTAVWQQVEIGWLRADQSTWRDLAGWYGDPVVELGCGRGRICLDLAAAGHRVIGVDRDPELLMALEADATDRGLRVETRETVVGSNGPGIALGAGIDPAPPSLVIAPLHFVNLLSDAQIADLLARICSSAFQHPTIALSVLDDPPPSRKGDSLLAATPEMMERDEAVISSRTTRIEWEDDLISIERERSIVDSDGALTRRHYTEKLRWLGVETLVDQFGHHGYLLARSEAMPVEEGNWPARLLVFEKKGPADG